MGITSDTISENLKLLYSLSNMTVSDMSLDLGVSRQTVSKYINGKILPDTHFLTDICRLLEIPFTALLIPDSAGFKRAYSLYTDLSPLEKQFLQFFRNLSDFQKGYISEIILKGCVADEEKHADGSEHELKKAPSGGGADLG